jgi:hypothetical protein
VDVLRLHRPLLCGPSAQLRRSVRLPKVWRCTLFFSFELCVTPSAQKPSQRAGPAAHLCLPTPALADGWTPAVIPHLRLEPYPSSVGLAPRRTPAPRAIPWAHTPREHPLPIKPAASRPTPLSRTLVRRRYLRSPASPATSHCFPRSKSCPADRDRERAHRSSPDRRRAPPPAPPRVTSRRPQPFDL